MDESERTDKKKVTLKRGISVALFLATLALLKATSEKNPQPVDVSSISKMNPLSGLSLEATLLPTNIAEYYPDTTVTSAILTPEEPLSDSHLENTILYPNEVTTSGFPKIKIAIDLEGDHSLNIHFMDIVSNGIKISETSLASEYIKSTLLPVLLSYPSFFFENTEQVPTSIILTTELQAFDKISNSWHPIKGAARCREGQSYIYLNMGADLETIHHELFHHISELIITSENGNSLDITKTLEDITASEGLTYTPELSLEEISHCTDTYPNGFASCYGKKDATEDGATIVAKLMTGNKKLFKRIQTDLVLKQKVDAIVQWYNIVTNGVINEDYFRNLIK